MFDRGVQNINIVRGAPYRQTFTISGDDAPESLTDYAITMRIKRLAGDASALLSLSTAAPTAGGSTITITNADELEYEVFISETDVNALPQDAPQGFDDQFVHQQILVDEDSEKEPFIYGTAFVKPLI